MTRLAEQRNWLLLCLGLLLSLDMDVCLAASPLVQQSYRLMPNDLVHIQVDDKDDRNVESKIDGDGNIHYPLLGVLSVARKTVRELQDNLTARRADGYIRTPKVTVHVVRHRNIYVRGEVKTAGAYPYEEGLTMHKAITMAGGFTDKASTNNAKVLRTIEGNQHSSAIGLDALVQPGDILVISRSFFLKSFRLSEKGTPKVGSPSAARTQSGWYWAMVRVPRWEVRLRRDHVTGMSYALVGVDVGPTGKRQGFWLQHALGDHQQGRAGIHGVYGNIHTRLSFHISILLGADVNRYAYAAHLTNY